MYQRNPSLPPRYIVCLCYLSDVRHRRLSSTFLSSGPFVWLPPWSILRMVPSILQGRLLSCLSFWWNFCRSSSFQEAFSFFSYTLFLLFPSSLLVWCCPLRIFLSFLSFQVSYKKEAYLNGWQKVKLPRSRSITSNYRPITYLPRMRKILTPTDKRRNLVPLLFF